MAVSTSITFNRRQVKRVERLLRDTPEQVPVVMMRALRRTGDQVRVRVVRAVADNINVQRSKLFQRGNRRRPIQQPIRATRSRLEEKVTVSGARLPLGRFGARQLYVKGRTRGRRPSRVTYRIDKRGPRRSITDAFVPKLRSGFVGVFRRRPGGGLQQLYGPSIPHVAEQRPQVKALLSADAGDLLEKNVDSQLDHVLSKGRARRG